MTEYASLTQKLISSCLCSRLDCKLSWLLSTTMLVWLEVLLMILDKLTTQELMSSTEYCTMAMIHDYHVITSEREGRKASREKPSRHPKTHDLALHLSALVDHMVH